MHIVWKQENRNNMKQLILIAFLLIFQISVFAQEEATAYNRAGNSASQEQLEKLNLKVFPNPVKDKKITLKMSEDQMSEIRLVNIVGKEVLKKNFEFGVTSYEMQLNDVPKGIYLVQVKTTANKAIVKKLLVSGN